MKKATLSVLILFLLLYILPLGVRPIVVPDESRYAEIPREMLVSGDWVVPHLNGVRYFEKPVLGYWFNALSIMLFGENAFAIRLSSAIAAGISALIVFVLAWRFAGRCSAGILAALIQLTCLLPFAIGGLTVLDSVLSMLLTAGMASFFFAHEENIRPKKILWLALFGAFCGLAFLTKGFLAFAVPMVTIVPFMIWEGRWRDIFRIPWIPVAAAVLVTLPWSLMIHFREPDFWNYFFWTEHISRFLSPVAGQHNEPFWYFVPIMIGGALPWIALLPAAVQGIKHKYQHSSLVRFSLCWFLFPFLFFSACGGKLSTYILPCFPPLSVLMAVGLYGYSETKKSRAFKIGTSTIALLGGILALGLLVTQLTDIFGVRAYSESEAWKWPIGVGVFLVWSLLSLLAATRRDFFKGVALFCAGTAVFLFSANFIIPDQVMEERAPGKFLARQAYMIRKDTPLFSDKYLIHAVCWFYKRNDVTLVGKSGEHAYGLSYDESRHRLLTVKQFAEHIRKMQGKEAILITEAEFFEKYGNQLPKPKMKVSDAGFVFAQF